MWYRPLRYSDRLYCLCTRITGPPQDLVLARLACYQVQSRDLLAYTCVVPQRAARQRLVHIGEQRKPCALHRDAALFLVIVLYPLIVQQSVQSVPCHYSAAAAQTAVNSRQAVVPREYVRA